MLAINHDSQNDILYIGIGDKRNSYGDEISSGIIVMHDIDTEEITGVTILDFSQQYKSHKLNHLPIAINFEKDVLPRI